MEGARIVGQSIYFDYFNCLLPAVRAITQFNEDAKCEATSSGAP